MSNRQLNDLTVKPLDVYSLLGNVTRATKPGVDTFRFNYLRTELLRKYVEIDASKDLLAPTLKKAREQEAKNRLINEAGYAPIRGQAKLLRTARRFVADVLGEFSYDVYKAARFSGGSSTSRRYEYGAPYFKFNTRKAPLDVTPEAYSRAIAVLNLTNVWGGTGSDAVGPAINAESKVCVRVVTSNEVSTVPKEAEIERTIGKEPDLNMMLQLALGAGIRDKLSLHGLNLDFSWRTNQKLARKGSIDGKSATVDLRNASSSITDRAVWDLFPDDWYTELNATRSKSGLWPDTGEHVKWEQFSSMGNGFTFELETLLFLSLCVAVMHEAGITPRIGHNVTVFGDDIIIPVECYGRLQELCESMGFEFNQKKSFKRGFFRESCGGYFFNGCDVKPFRIKEPVDTLPRVIWLLNAIRRFAATNHDGTFGEICDPRLHEMYKGIYRKYRKHFKHRLPYYKKGRLLHTSVDITGGRDLYSSTSVVTPGVPRDVLQLASVRERKLNGAAYCAYSQGVWVRGCKRAIGALETGIQPIDRRWNSPAMVKTSYQKTETKWVESSASGLFALIKVDDSTGRFISNRAGPWSVKPPVFSEELTGA